MKERVEDVKKMQFRKIRKYERDLRKYGGQREKFLYI